MSIHVKSRVVNYKAVLTAFNSCGDLVDMYLHLDTLKSNYLDSPLKLARTSRII